MAVAFRPAMNPTAQSDSRATLDEVGALLARAAGLLYVNGQSTRNMIERMERLARALGYSAECFPNWEEILICIAQPDEPHAQKIVPVAGPPAGVDMNKVMKTLEVVDEVSAGRLDVAGASAALERVARLRPASTLRFVAFAGIGAAALGVIFGAGRLADLVLIGLSAAAGALVRRLIAARGGGALIQTLCAGLLAGLAAALTLGFAPTANAYLVALCPCMVLMPGAHLLNAALDFAHLRVALGQARFGFAMLLTLLICVGLIAGLSVARQTLPPPAPVAPTPLAFDVLAAGLAVAAYGAFFSMPWRALPIPVLIGMFAHACRWFALSSGANAALGALIACAIAGALVTPIANRLHLPFAGFAFASVVSLVPGAYLFRLAAELAGVMNAGADGSVQLLMAPFEDGVTAGAILLAMGLGVSLPKLMMEGLFPALAGLERRSDP
jgi:uncharacterized membrane protein YjjP (DUF1212 family)